MSIEISYKKYKSNNKIANLILFVDEKYNIAPQKKHFNKYEIELINDLLKLHNLSNKIVSFDLSSKKKTFSNICKY